MRSVKYKFDEIVPRLSILIIPLNGFQNYHEHLMCQNDLHESLGVFSERNNSQWSTSEGLNGVLADEMF